MKKKKTKRKEMSNYQVKYMTKWHDVMPRIGLTLYKPIQVG